MSQFSKRYYIFLIFFLGMLSAFGPFVTDMYLPTLPSMADVFNTTPSLVQMGLATSMLGLAIGQIFFGPLSDKYGRRPVLIAALILFAVSTVVSIYSPTIEFFNICRFLQGLGGSGGIVLSRSVSTDCYSGRELAKTLAIIGAVNGIAPVTAPVVGGLIAKSVGWQGIFWILFGIGMVLLAMCLAFKESLTADKRYTGTIGSLMKGFPLLLRLPYFRVYILMFGFANGVLFSYISSASFIIQNYFGFSELEFALIFGVNSISIGIGSGLSLKYKQISKASLVGAAGITTAAILQLIMHFVCDSFVIYEALTVIMLIFLGHVFTSSTTLAMNEGRERIGAASAIFGAIGFIFGGLVSPLVGIGNIMTTTAIIISISAACTLLFAIAASRRKPTDVSDVL
jgi:DHA1 family bicyclomycin/chloramphenicol resistance-like MFS transporter